MSATPTIAETARAYRAGTRSPVEVTAACLRRIAEHDGRIRAFATVTDDLARWQARAAQEQVAGDPDLRRPLLGIPVGVKDIVDVAGVPTGAGSDAVDADAAITDATVWRRLAEAGAVLVGKTRTHELAYGVATPPTRNPVDTGRMPGGSSGGSAAALAAGMCLGAVGTDTAGSIRIPAGLCGVVGHKPTRGLCPTDGILPLSPSLDHAGPMALDVGDVALLLDAMAATATQPPWPPRSLPLSGLRVGLATTDALWSTDVRAAFDRTVAGLADAGARVEPVATPSFEAAVWHTDRIIGVEAGVVHADLLDRAGARLGSQTRAKLESAGRVDGPTYYRALRHAEQVRLQFIRALTTVDVLLAPGVATTAPAYGADTVVLDCTVHRLGRALCWNAAALNMAGLPAVALPAGSGVDGLPVGVQLIGAAGTDANLLRLATAVTAMPRPDG